MSPNAQSCRDALLVSSELLTYPDPALFERIPQLEVASGALPRPVRERIGRFLGYLRSQDQITLQQDYVRTFDFQGGVPLYLTYPKFGDDRKRGQALADLKQRYRSAGFVPTSPELPDYLPLVLEFLGLGDRRATRGLARDFLPTVRQMARALQRTESPYGAILETAADAMAQLARASLPGRRSVP